jgi:hypothetical protein
VVTDREIDRIREAEPKLIELLPIIDDGGSLGRAPWISNFQRPSDKFRLNPNLSS